jgi:hypothetical protein
MPANESYIAVFYEQNKPRTSIYALYKRISRDKYLNLTDGDSFTKTVELFSEEGLNGRYQILETMTFNTVSLIENISYVICITKKVNF